MLRLVRHLRQYAKHTVLIQLLLVSLSWGVVSYRLSDGHSRERESRRTYSRLLCSPAVRSRKGDEVAASPEMTPLNIFAINEFSGQIFSHRRVLTGNVLSRVAGLSSDLEDTVN